MNADSRSSWSWSRWAIWAKTLHSVRGDFGAPTSVMIRWSFYLVWTSHTVHNLIKLLPEVRHVLEPVVDLLDKVAGLVELNRLVDRLVAHMSG